ncbi:hypothetical protein M0G43_01515 [Subsaxibacter sp. CAU 1640]|uniref:hypothetical protein n=1 Tax=Subsaxibacter sp. CAU 1640 TaxID=2933271 RepID=UPI0020059E7E|nr:hypothetical protein [Subsaxibacter sp. CAU 1640]MCK7589242.1 hypothetical protein [Subsaxibacter sp. CAU 1640]
MKYIIALSFILSIASIILGFLWETDFSQKMIGGGVAGLFIIAFPLFSWYRWKDKKVEDYMLTKENLKKMREREGDKRR